MMKHRYVNPIKAFILNWITCGIYGMWMCSLINEELNDKQDEIKLNTNLFIMLILDVCTAGLYSFYLAYQMISAIKIIGVSKDRQFLCEPLYALLACVLYLAAGTGLGIILLLILELYNGMQSKEQGVKTQSPLSGLARKQDDDENETIHMMSDEEFSKYMNPPVREAVPCTNDLDGALDNLANNNNNLV